LYSAPIEVKNTIPTTLRLAQRADPHASEHMLLRLKMRNDVTATAGARFRAQQVQTRERDQRPQKKIHKFVAVCAV
jgi:hypothetical protein